MKDMKRLKVCVDRVIPAHSISRHIELSIKEHAGNRPSSVPENVTRNPMFMAMLVAKLWKPGRTLRVKFLDGDPNVQARVADVAREWMSYADINLSFVKSGDAEIRISFADSGSWSYVGTEALSVPISSATMNYGWLDQTTPDDEYQRVVLHEFGHALGCIHEHQSPTADGLPWDKEKVYAYFGGSPNFWPREEVDRNIFDRYSQTETNFTTLDPTSIMMYRFPPELFTNGFSTPENRSLSALDKQFMAQHYPRNNVQLGESTLAAALDGIDIDRLTPIAALQAIVELKSLLAGRHADPAAAGHVGRGNGAAFELPLRAG